MTREQASTVVHILGTAERESFAIVKIVASLADHLSRDKYRMHVCFLGGSGPLADQLRTHGVTVACVEWACGARDPAGAYRFASFMRRQNVSVVHQHYGGRSVAWLARRMSGAPVILHVHSTVNENQPANPHLVYHAHAKVVIANSRATAASIDHPRVQVIYPGIDFSNLRVCAQVSKARVIGAAGRLAPIKGMTNLIDAFAFVLKEFPDVLLEIAGSGVELPELEAKIRRLGLERRVKFLGWLDDLSAAFARWEIFAQPSLQEGFGMSILEAMAHGLPVVASCVGGIPELVQNGSTGILVPPGKPFELGAALIELLRDPARACTMGQRGRDRAGREFPASAMSSEFREIYDSLLGLRRYLCN